MTLNELCYIADIIIDKKDYSHPSFKSKYPYETRIFSEKGYISVKDSVESNILGYVIGRGNTTEEALENLVVQLRNKVLVIDFYAGKITPQYGERWMVKIPSSLTTK